MTNLTPITRQHFQHKFWHKPQTFSFASKRALVPVSVAELPMAVKHLPLTFARYGDSYVLVALLSYAPNKNLFVSADGKWLGGYIPAEFRSYPFSLNKAADGSRMVFCVNEDSGLVSEQSGEPFLDHSGELSGPAKEMFDFCRKHHQNRNLTDQLTSSLARAGVITEWNLKTSDGYIPGLYKVDEPALKSLDDTEFLKLRQALPMAYAQLLSMSNVQLFPRLAGMQPREEPDLENMEELDIDWDKIKI